MTRTDAVAEQAIAAIDAAARRTRDADRMGERGADGLQERDVFSDVLKRMVEGGFSLRGPLSAEGSGTCASQGARGRPLVGAGDGHELHQPSATEEGGPAPELRAAEENVPAARNNGVGELLQAVVGVLVPDNVRAGQPAELMPGGRPEVGPATLQEIPSARTRLFEGPGMGVANTEAEVRVSVITRETHYAPVAPASLSGPATERAVIPANLGTGLSAHMALSSADRSASAENPPSAEAVQVSGAVDVTARSRSGVAGEESEDGFRHRMLATQEAKVGAEDGQDAEPAGRKAAPAAAAGEARVSGVGSPQSAPATPAASVLPQVVDRITTMLSQPSGDTPDTSAKGTTAAAPSAGSQLKVLRIELQPAELGTIEVHLSLREDALELKLDASRAETATLIARDKDTLANMLRSAGYLIDGLTVQVVESDRGVNAGIQPGGHGMQTSSQSMGQAHTGSSQPDGRSDRTDRQPQHNGQGPNSFEQDEHASDQRNRRPADGALYV